jgi:CBS domain-containing protein
MENTNNSHTGVGVGRMPSPSLMNNFRQELLAYPPFAQMREEDIDYFLAHCTQRYFAPDEHVIGPADGPVVSLFFVRKGAVTGTRGLADQLGSFEYEAGDLFPASAAFAGRAVTANYRACEDTFLLALPIHNMHQLAQRCAPFAEHLTQRAANFLNLSRKALQEAFAANAMTQQTLDSPLAQLINKPPVTCTAQTPLRQALQTMHQARIGSMLVVDTVGHPIGILTRHDILSRVTLPGVALDTTIENVMVRPVLSLTAEHTAQDAALLMSRHGIRHVPVTRNGAAAGMVSERDLFAMQRQSLKGVSTELRCARDLAELQVASKGIRRLTRSLLGQGVQARQLTTMISHLNDVLTERLLHIQADAHGVDLKRLCWLCLGSEGRNEQTIATDQDNAIILANDTDPETREAVRAFAHSVNLALETCGFPLCKGGIMAGEASCCLALDEWHERFRQWIEQGSPEHLLNASIYFDFRPLAGDFSLADALRKSVSQTANTTPRFLKQMALNALTRTVPLNWRGAIDSDPRGMLDLKLRGTAIFVDAARIYSLANGIQETNTQRRLEAVGLLLKLAKTEYDAWVSGFEFLQMLRLRIQLQTEDSEIPPNEIKVASLNDIDRRILRESIKVAHRLQQRLQLDYER